MKMPFQKNHRNIKYGQTDRYTSEEIDILEKKYNAEIKRLLYGY